MPQRYFDKFPKIEYNNNTVVDITRRVALLEKISSNPYVFYPYEITANERADQLSSRYYEDSYRSWLLYISNKIVDPYQEWYLHEKEFFEFLELKYGSYYDAQRKTKYYINDWKPEEEITVSQFNALTVGMKKYWEPEFGSGNRIIRYRRKQIDWKSNTNRIVSYDVSNSSFIIDEICDIHFDNFNVGKGQVVSSKNNKLYLQHISGTHLTSETVSITSNSYIYGDESKSNVTFTAATLKVDNIPADEDSYWKPVTYYEYELEKNEFNKIIRVIDSSLKQVAVDNLKELLSE